MEGDGEGWGTIHITYRNSSCHSEDHDLQGHLNYTLITIQAYNLLSYILLTVYSDDISSSMLPTQYHVSGTDIMGAPPNNVTVYTVH